MSDDAEPRDRGALSPADREYLRGDRELGSVQAERNARARIRDRVYDALSARRLRERLDAGESLTLTEIAYLHRSDAVRDDELARYLAEDPEVDDGRIQSRVTDF